MSGPQFTIVFEALRIAVEDAAKRGVSFEIGISASQAAEISELQRLAATTKRPQQYSCTTI